MSEFEKWFICQDFYTNMRFIHGDKLFDKDGDVYRVLPVQMVYQGWSVQRQRSEDEFVALTQEWHAKGWNNHQEEVDQLQKRINEALEELEFPTASWEETVYAVIQILKGGAIQCRHIFQEATAWGDKARTLVCQNCSLQREVPFYALDVELKQQTNRGANDINLTR